jgi:ATP-dependent Lhr-like helicase
VIARETLAPPWQEILVALRRLEARGENRGGRFVAGYVGEPYTLPEAIEAVRAARRGGESSDSEAPPVAAYDPLAVIAGLLPGVSPRPLRAIS